MEMKKLIDALGETISFLQNSQSSVYADMPVEEIIEKLESEIAKVKSSKPIDSKLLRLLFAPTAPIQDTAIDNGWGDEYLRISNNIDGFTVDK